jgi:hypothetical protein
LSAAAGYYRADCYKVRVSCILALVLEKGNPAARRVRKATGLPEKPGRQPGRRKETTRGDYPVVLLGPAACE